MEEDLTEIVQLVGKDSLNEGDKITLEIAQLLRDDFLQQNGFSTYDKYCPFYKTVWMLRNFAAYYDLAQKALDEAPTDQKLTWNQIKQHTQDVLNKLPELKFREPSDGEQANVDYYKEVHQDIVASFKDFNDSLM